MLIICSCTSSHSTFDNPLKSRYPSTPDYPDTSAPSSRYPPQTGGSVPSPAPAEASSSRWRSACRGPSGPLRT